METACPSCHFVYEINESKIPDKGAYAVCKKCKNRFFLQKPKETDSIKPKPEDTPTVKKENKTQSCPKCGFESDLTVKECPKCGVIIKKAIQKVKGNQPVSTDNKAEKQNKDFVSKYSTWIYFLRWVLGASFLLAGITVMFYNQTIKSIVYLALAILFIPTIYHLIRPNPDFKVGIVAKGFSLLVGIICILVALGAFCFYNILQGIVCLLFGVLLFPDVYAFLTDKDTKLIQIAGVTVVIIVGGLVASQFMLKSMDADDRHNAQVTDWRETDNSVKAHYMMEKFIKRDLKAPSTANFSSYGESEVQKLDNHKYRVKLWVDAQNSFGATVRGHYIGEIQQVSDDKWSLISLNRL